MSDRAPPRSVDDTFAIIEKAVLAGERCPTASSINSGHVSKLAKTGRIRVEIYTLNYRVVTLLTGEHAGKTTKPAPQGEKPWQILDESGRRINGQIKIGNGQPSRAKVSLAQMPWDKK